MLNIIIFESSIRFKIAMKGHFEVCNQFVY